MFKRTDLRMGRMTVIGLIAAALTAGLGATTHAAIVTSGLVMHYSGENYDQGTGVWTNTGSAGAAANAGAGGGGNPTAIGAAADLNNQPAVEFNGANDLSGSYSPALFAGGEATVLVVANIGTSTAYDLFWSSNRTDTFTSFGGGGFSGLFRTQRVEGTYGGMPAGDLGSYLFTTVSTTSGFEVLLDNVTKGTAAADFLANGSFRIGGNASGNDLFTGRIAEILVYNRVLTVNEMKATAGALGIKYDLVVANVPEPASVSLLALGGLLVLGRVRPAGR